MKMHPIRTHVVLFVVLSLFLSHANLWGGGDAADRDHEEDGLAFFGFVKDTAGRIIRDAKVTADIKGLGSVVARTDATGVYKLPGFGKEISANRVSISCAKDGYKQVRTFTRTPPTKAPATRVEVECTMQQIGAQ
jgi:hypothetical protein